MSLDPGDLVKLVDACCERTRASIGWVGRVEQVAVVLESAPCAFCGHVSTDMWQAAITIEQPGFVPARWLRKIDPTAERELALAGEGHHQGGV